MNEDNIKRIVRGITEKLNPHHYIGQIIKIKGRRAKITSGSFYGDFGRVSNHWEWKYLDGKKPKTGNGYL